MAKNKLNTELIYKSFFVLCLVDGTLTKKVPLKVLNLSKGDVCGHSEDSDTYYCKSVKDCKPFVESIKNNNYFDVCCFIGKEPIVCCPPISDNKTLTNQQPKYHKKIQNTNVAVQKCREYTKLNFPKFGFYRPYVMGGTRAEPQEFPHMAILGYGETITNRYDWKCGGSLISYRWILSAAHCYQTGSIKVEKVRWARLGELDISSTVDIAKPRDYRIIKHVLHPDFTPPERYNDIALFYLDTVVEFSAYIRPICLNTDPSLNPTQLIATGWGSTATGAPVSEILLKVKLDIFPASQCNNTFFSEENKGLTSGINSDRMICAGSIKNNADTCFGDSGGPLQGIIDHGENDLHVFTQFGITSFGTGFCGVGEEPAVYTKVSGYVPWIEETVWSRDE